MTYSILQFGSLPPKIAFFCPHCVDGNGVKKSPYKPYGDMNCSECNNRRLIANHEHVHKITKDYCIPEEDLDIFRISPGSYYILLLTNVEIKGGITEDLFGVDNLVNSARFIKDRFFFGKPLTDSFFNQIKNFVTEIAWIPR